MEDVKASRADEGRGTLREAPLRCVQPQEAEISEWGNPAAEEAVIPRGRGTT